MLPDLYTGFSRGRSGGLVFPSLSEFSTVYCDPHIKGFGIVNNAEIGVFLELSCLFNDPADVGNLIFGFSAFSKTSLNPPMLSIFLSCTFVIIDPTMTHHYQSRSLYYGSLLILYTLWVLTYLQWPLSIISYRGVHCFEKTVNIPPSSSLWQPLILFTVSMVLPFSVCEIVEIVL